MEIKTKYQIKRKQIKDLEIMKAYIIYDSEWYENQLIIVDINHEAIIFRKYDNDNSLCIFKRLKDEYVNLIGQVDDLDIVNVKFR
jgi:hypothetical protein